MNAINSIQGDKWLVTMLMLFSKSLFISATTWAFATKPILLEDFRPAMVTNALWIVFHPGTCFYRLPNCDSPLETSCHTLLRCPFAYSTWNKTIFEEIHHLNWLYPRLDTNDLRFSGCLIAETTSITTG